MSLHESSQIRHTSLNEKLRVETPHGAVKTGPAESLDRDAELMLRAKEGDVDAFEELVNRYRRPMLAFMYRSVHDQAIAEELAQEVFLRVYKSRQSYAAKAKFSTWLYRITSNLAINHARDNGLERANVVARLDEPGDDTSPPLDVADASPSAEQSILKRERLAAIRRHVEELPERQRLAVIMHKYQGLDYREIGKVLTLSESATKSLLFRAYETLRDKLKEFV